MVAAPRTASPGRPMDPEKRAAVLEAAKALFLARGYDGTSMDAVAQAAGVSKLTVYSHFQDKDTLFVEAVKAARRSSRRKRPTVSPSGEMATLRR